MDVLYFLRERTKFLRTFYVSAADVFVERQRKINDGEAPYDERPAGYNPEYGEPPYFPEWQQAEDSIDFLGQAGISFLSASLGLYLDEFRAGLGRHKTVPEFDTKLAKRDGALAAYRKWFSELGADLADAGCDLGIIEQIFLARNSVQHPKSIGLLALRPSAKQKAKYSRPFFVHPLEEVLVAGHLENGNEPHRDLSWMQVSREKLMVAISEVEKLCAWIDKKFLPWSSADNSH